MNPILSIVTITYHDSAGLRRTLESLKYLSNLEISWEHVVVDSSPKENAPTFGSQEFKGRVHIVAEPKGIYPALNLGLASAQGKYVLFLNGGDALKDPATLSRMINKLDTQHELDVVIAAAELYRDGQFLYNSMPRPGWKENLIGGNRICQQAVLYRRDSLNSVGKFSEKWKLAADYEHHWRCYLADLKVECITECLVRYDMGGASSQVQRVFAEYRSIQKELSGSLSPSMRLMNLVRWQIERSRIGILHYFKKSAFGAALQPFWLAWNRRGNLNGAGPDHVSIFGVKVSRLGFEEALEQCERRASLRQGGYVCFSNVHTVTDSLRIPELFRALNESFLSVADGVPLIWSSKLKRKRITSRVCGPDFMEAFLKRHAEWSFGFIGGAPEQADELARRYCKAGMAITYCPPMRAFSDENVKEDVARFVAKTDEIPKVIWVGLGAPKQELWMRTASQLLPNTLFFGVGAAFDFLTDRKSRAPAWMQKAGLEWLFRLLSEPGRLWKRYLVTNTLFVLCMGFEVLAEVTGRQK
jgi:N-acetylglucosaminyldiphosphoundecaprenol N-acetyl-beta-D-mannosaminyltransferase